MGKINDKMEKWFQDDISMVSRKKEISCFTHKPINVSLVSLDKSRILSGCFHQKLKKNIWTFFTFH